LGVWAGLDVFVSADRDIVRKSVSDGVAKRIAVHCRSSLYSQSHFQSRLHADSIRIKKQPPGFARHSPHSRHAHLDNYRDFSTCEVGCLYANPLPPLGFIRNNSAIDDHVFEQIKNERKQKNTAPAMFFCSWVVIGGRLPKFSAVL